LELEVIGPVVPPCYATGHSLKNLGPFQKNLGPPNVPSWLQAWIAPGSNLRSRSDMICIS